MVVIVNALPAVDKTEFVYSVNGLRTRGVAGQALYRCCTDVGQKAGEQKNRLFCTSGPVDMQDLFHSRAGFACQPGLAGCERCCGCDVGIAFFLQTKGSRAVVASALDAAVPSFFFFADKRAFASCRLCRRSLPRELSFFS